MDVRGIPPLKTKNKHSAVLSCAIGGMGGKNVKTLKLTSWYLSRSCKGQCILRSCDLYRKGPKKHLAETFPGPSLFSCHGCYKPKSQTFVEKIRCFPCKISVCDPWDFHYVEDQGILSFSRMFFSLSTSCSEFEKLWFVHLL